MSHTTQLGPVTDDLDFLGDTPEIDGALGEESPAGANVRADAELSELDGNIARKAKVTTLRSCAPNARRAKYQELVLIAYNHTHARAPASSARWPTKRELISPTTSSFAGR